jgi:hypothetical protein
MMAEGSPLPMALYRSVSIRPKTINSLDLSMLVGVDSRPRQAHPGDTGLAVLWTDEPAFVVPHAACL